MVGVSVRGGSSDHHHDSPSKSGRSRSRHNASHESSLSTRDIQVVTEQEEDQLITPFEHSYKEYSPSTSNREDYQEQVLSLHGEISMLRDDLYKSREETIGVKYIMHHLQRGHHHSELVVC